MWCGLEGGGAGVGCLSLHVELRCFLLRQDAGDEVASAAGSGGAGEARSDQWGQTSHSAYLASQHCRLLRKTFSSQRALFLRTRNIFTVATQAGRETDRMGGGRGEGQIIRRGKPGKESKKRGKTHCSCRLMPRNKRNDKDEIFYLWWALCVTPWPAAPQTR